MVLNILLTESLKKTIPDSISIDFNFGEIKVIFPPDTTDDDIIVKIGDNVIINGEKEDILNWLKKFNSVAINSTGSPMLEEFELINIKNLL
jgi:hypothetical protein